MKQGLRKLPPAVLQALGRMEPLVPWFISSPSPGDRQEKVHLNSRVEFCPSFMSAWVLRAGTGSQKSPAGTSTLPVRRLSEEAQLPPLAGCGLWSPHHWSHRCFTPRSPSPHVCLPLREALSQPQAESSLPPFILIDPLVPTPWPGFCPGS